MTSNEKFFCPPKSSNLPLIHTTPHLKSNLLFKSTVDDKKSQDNNDISSTNFDFEKAHKSNRSHVPKKDRTNTFNQQKKHSKKS